MGIVACFFLVGCGPPSPPNQPSIEEQLKKEKERADAAERKVITQGNELNVVVFFSGIAIFVLGCLAWRFYKHRQVVVFTPAHCIVDNSFVIDGTNVAHNFKNNEPSFLILLTLLRVLLEQQKSFKCYFDASTFYLLNNGRPEGEAEADAYRSFIRKFPDWFIEAPSQTEADTWILDYAHKNGLRIIGNDNYKKYIPMYRWLKMQKYPWLPKKPSRLIKGLAHSGRLHVPSLGIDEPVATEFAGTISQFRQLLQSRVQ